VLTALHARWRTTLLAAGYVDAGAALDRAETTAAGPAGSFPVLAHREEAVARAAEEVDDALAAVLGPLAATAPWEQTASYVREPPSPGFLDGYAHTTLAAGDGVAVGLLLLGPGVHYPPHHHPAEEFYLPAACVRWVHALDAEPAPEPAGVVVHHAPWQPHGMITDDRPALFAYVWIGEVATPSAFC
jgi:hypothetical protein